MEVTNYVARLQDITPTSINKRVINHPTKYTKHTLQFILNKEKSIIQAHVYNEAGEILRQFPVEDAISRARHLNKVSG